MSPPAKNLEILSADILAKELCLLLDTEILSTYSRKAELTQALETYSLVRCNDFLLPRVIDVDPAMEPAPKTQRSRDNDYR